MKNEIWKLTKFPRNKISRGSKWLYNLKYKAIGSKDKYKAILVAKIYSQKEDIEYEDTFARVAKMNTIRMMITLATIYNWKLHQLHVKLVLLNEDLEK